jgi:hypothetical protein
VPFVSFVPWACATWYVCIYIYIYIKGFYILSRGGPLVLKHILRGNIQSIYLYSYIFHVDIFMGQNNVRGIVCAEFDFALSFDGIHGCHLYIDI